MSVPDRHLPATLDGLYQGLSFRDKLRLFWYGYRVDDALAEADVDADRLHPDLRRAAKIIGMLGGWTPQEIAGALGAGSYQRHVDVFTQAGLTDAIRRWTLEGKRREQELEHLAEVSRAIAVVAFGTDTTDLADREEVERELTKLEEIIGMKRRKGHDPGGAPATIHAPRSGGTMRGFVGTAIGLALSLIAIWFYFQSPIERYQVKELDEYFTYVKGEDLYAKLNKTVLFFDCEALREQFTERFVEEMEENNLLFADVFREERKIIYYYYGGVTDEGRFLRDVSYIQKRIEEGKKARGSIDEESLWFGVMARLFDEYEYQRKEGTRVFKLAGGPKCGD